MKKTIIILGEEYWFEKVNTIFTEATYLLKKLKKYQDKRFNYEIIKTPTELLPIINKIQIQNIRAIFLFQDVISDSYLNNKTINEMINYLNYLQSNNIFIYPPPNIINNFGSKKYNYYIPKWAQLPYTKTVFFKNYNPSDEYKIYKTLWFNLNQLWIHFNKVVIKKGYSYEGKQVITFNKENIKDFKEFKNKAFKLNFKNFWGRKLNANSIDKDTDRYYIIQPFNKIITKRENEYRVFFHNGIPKYIAKGDRIPNVCTNDINNNLVYHVIKFAKKLYKEYIPTIWKLDRQPILFRIDVSYAIDPNLQDEYSINIDGFDTSIRLYANELEIDPTSFFYNAFECKTLNNFSSKLIQKNFAKYLIKYIYSL
jgi:hypothetical protein